MTSAIQISSLSKSFDAKIVLHNLNWEIKAGSVIGLLGRNGAGKSTLLECMLGLRDVDKGNIRIFADNVDNLSSQTKEKIGYVPQTVEIFGWLNAKQLFSYFRSMYTHWNSKKVEQLMRRWELPDDVAISKLSVGQKQRLSIIRALAHEPALLILDEPVASLDPAGRRDFLRELIEQTEQQTTIVFSTHILSDLERVAMDVAVLKDGNIVLQQNLDELIETTLRITISNQDLHALPEHTSLKHITLNDGYTSVLAQFSIDDQEKLRSSTNFRAEKLSLEDLFIELA